jgi:hypothetical protein
MRTMRQCCGGECNNNIHCEEDAWRRYQKQRMKAYKLLLTSKIVLYTIPFIIGFILGKLL